MSRSWMNSGVMLAGMAGVLVATPVQATADDTQVAAVTSRLDRLLVAAVRLEDPKQTMTLDDFEPGDLTACTEVVAAAEAAGVAADGRLYPSGAALRSQARRDDQDRPYLTLDAVRIFCKDFERAVVQEWAEAAVVGAWYRVNDKTMKQPAEGMLPNDAFRVIDAGEVCATRVNAALAAGLPAGHLLTSPFHKMPGIALGDAQAQYCQPLIEWGTRRLAEIEGAATATYDAIVATYTEAGIKGERLELFVSRGLPDDAGWLAPGCRKWIDTAKAMKKAKKMFHWFVDDDGLITVRKYTFKGDKYDVSEWQYVTEAAAYRGCK